MFAWQATVQNEYGNVVVNPKVTVYLPDGVTLAQIYNEDGSPRANPFIGTLEGFVQFWAEAGSYKIIGVYGEDQTAEWSVTIDAPAIRAEEAADRSESAADIAGEYAELAGEAAARIGLSPRDFGAVGDGLTDDTSAVQASVYWMLAQKGRRIVDRSASTYRVTGTISGVGTVDIDWGQSRFLKNRSGVVFSFNDTTPLGPFYLSADYAPNSVNLSVSGIPAMKAGTRVKFVSRAVDPHNRDQGSRPVQDRVAEWAIVASSTGNSLVLGQPLTNTEGISPVSVVGDEPRIPAYTVDMNACLFVYADEHTFSMKGGKVTFDTDDTSVQGDGIVCRFYKSPVIEGFTLEKGHRNGITVAGTWGAEIKDPKISHLTNNIGAGNLGYGISDQGWQTTVWGGLVEDVRHAYTTGGGNTAWPPSAVVSASLGRTIGGQCISVHAIDCRDTSFDTHSDADNTSFINCISEKGRGYAFAARGRNINIVNPIVPSGANGIYVFTEFNSGIPDGDNFNAGKLLKDYTNALIQNPQISVAGVGLRVGTGVARVSGTGFLNSFSSTPILVEGLCDIDGNVSLGVADGYGPPSPRAAVQVVPCHQTASAAFPVSMVRVSAGGVLSIDHTGVFASPINVASSGCAFYNDGLVSCVLPPNTAPLSNFAAYSTNTGGIFRIIPVSMDGLVVNVPNRPNSKVIIDGDVVNSSGDLGYNGTVRDYFRVVGVSVPEDKTRMRLERGSGFLDFRMSSGRYSVTSTDKPLFLETGGDFPVSLRRNSVAKLTILNDVVQLNVVPEYATRDAAVAAGVPVGGMYKRTGHGLDVV